MIRQSQETFQTHTQAILRSATSLGNEKCYANKEESTRAVGLDEEYKYRTVLAVP
jgi:hypothetical protein